MADWEIVDECKDEESGTVVRITSCGTPQIRRYSFEIGRDLNGRGIAEGRLGRHLRVSADLPAILARLCAEALERIDARAARVP